MSIKSSPFGNTKLSGEDARRFVQLMEEAKPNSQAQRTFNNGRKLLAQLSDNGIIIKVL